MLHDPRSMAAGVAALMDLHYVRGEPLLYTTNFSLLPSHSARHAAVWLEMHKQCRMQPAQLVDPCLSGVQGAWVTC